MDTDQLLNTLRDARLATRDDRTAKLEILTEAWQLAQSNVHAETEPQDRAYWAGYANAMHAAMLFVQNGRDPRIDTREGN